MVDWTQPSRLQAAADNPAAPKGLQQTASRLAGQQQEFAQGDSKLAPWLPKESMLERAQTWYGGQNQQGVDNGWNTDFYQSMFAQRDHWAQVAEREGSHRFYDWLNPEKNKTATGVTMWGADPTTTDSRFAGDRFGDVYQNGRKVSNLYDDYDRATADVMISEFMFDRNEKERLFSQTPAGPDGKWRENPALREAVEARRVQETQNKEFGRSASQFQDDIAKTQKGMVQGVGDEALVATAAVGGGLTTLGAMGTAAAVSGAAFSWTGPGALLAAGGAALLTGFAAWLNKDELTNIAARAVEVTDRADGIWQSFSTGAEEFGGLASKLVVPTSNLVKGLYDAKAGKVGDMESEFRREAGGLRQAGGWWQVADVAASVTDAVLQFASPIGRGMYMTTMGATTAGGVGGLFTGEGFNDRKGQFDKYENWKEWSAAIGSTVIDASQMGAAGAMASVSRTARTAAGMQTTGTMKAGETAIQRWGDKAWNAMPGSKWKIEGETFETVNGIRFGLDASGKAVSSRTTMELLAPSEFLRWVPTSWRARTMKQVDQGAVNADDMFRAAKELSNPNSKFTAAVINGWYEGSEEGIQAVLEPVSVSEDVRGGDVFNAFIYGYASGAGMSIGSTLTMPSTAKAEENRARTFAQLRAQRPMDDKEWKTYWKTLSPAERTQLSKGTEQERVQIEGVIKNLTELHQYSATESPIGLAAEHDMRVAQKWEKNLKKALKEGNGSLVLMGSTADTIVTHRGTREKWVFAPNTAVMTATEAVNQLRLIDKGLAKQRDFFTGVIADLSKDLTAAAGNPEVQANIQAKIDQATARRDGLEATRAVSTQFTGNIEAIYKRFVEETDEVEQLKLLRQINTLISKAFNGTLKKSDGTDYTPDEQKMIQRAVELRIARHPYQDTGSFALLMPQISPELTKVNAHATVYVHQATLKTLGGDHDGDTTVPQHDIYYDEARLQEARRGSQYVREMTKEERKKAAKKDPTIDPEATRYVLVSDAPDAEGAYIRAMQAASRDQNSPEWAAVKKEVEQLKKDFKQRYRKGSREGGSLEPQVLTDLLNTFEENVAAGEKDARVILIEGLLNATETSAQGIQVMADTTGIPEVLWMQGKINVAWDRVQREFGRLAATNRSQIKLGVPARTPKDNAFLKGRDREDALNAADDLSALGPVDPTRAAQTLHYSAFFQSSTVMGDLPDSGWTTEKRDELTTLYAQLGANETQSDIEKIEGKNAIEERVVVWLDQIANTIPGMTMTTPEIRLLLANTRVPDVNVVDLNTYEVTDNRITMLQLLLKKSLEIERTVQRKGGEDSTIMKKIAKLEEYTKPGGDTERSSTAALAVMEVFGNRQLHELLGETSMYIGPQMTLNQLKMMMTGMHTRSRRAFINGIKRAPAYMSHHGTGDAPWSRNVLVNAEINAFTMLVDAVSTGARSAIATMEDADGRAHVSFKDGLTGLHDLVDTWREQNSVRLQKEGKTSERDVLRDLLAVRPEVAAKIVEIIPQASRLGVFNFDGPKVFTANWVEEMLLEREPEKAAKMLFFHSKLAEFNVMGGTIDYARVEDDEVQEENPVGEVRFGRLKSRFLQVVHELASQPDGVALQAFLKMWHEAPSLSEAMRLTNENPLFRGDREKLLAYHDDVALFETDPRNVWVSGLDGADQRENLRGWGTSMRVYGSRAVSEKAHIKANRKLMANLVAHVDHGTNVDDAAGFFALVKLALENRKKFPDTTGQAARDIWMELNQIGLPRLHDKGKIDDLARAMGEPLITMDSWGYKNGVMQEADSLTAYDFSDLKTNLTKLTEGPVLLQCRDGSVVEIDISTPEAAVRYLADPRTQAFAIAVLFPTSRDINEANVVQAYQDVDNTGLISDMLLEQSYAHLFQEADSRSYRLKQAYRYISTIEAGVRKAALGKDPDIQQEMFFPIQNMIDDFLVAYLHSPRAGQQDPQKVRDQLVIDVADAIKAVSTLETDERAELKDIITAKMVEKWGGDESLVNNFLASTPERTIVRDSMLLQAQKIYKVQSDRYIQDILDAQAAGDADAVKVAKARLVDASTRFKALAKGDITALPKSTFRDVQTVLDTWTMTGDAALDGPRKTALLRYLNRKHRLNRIEDKDTRDLIAIVRSAVLRDPAQLMNPDLLEAADWQTLADWATTLYISELGARTSSEIGAKAIFGDDAAMIKRYYDKTWAYLTDALFDTHVLDMAVQLKQQATYDADLSVSEIEDQIFDGLLNPKKLGEWTDRAPIQSLKSRQMLLRAPVGAALSQEGNDPKELADIVRAGWVTWKLPDPDEHMSNWTMAMADDQRIMDALSAEPIGLVKLQNHFVNRVTVTYTDSQGNQVIEELFGKITQRNATHAEIENSGYEVLDLTKLDKRITEYRDKSGATGVVVEIDYVDQSKMPGSKEWANNIFFEGVGREAAIGAGGGPIAALFFSLGGLSKVGQQNPLDMATKKGKQFRAYLASKREVAQTIKADPTKSIEQKLSELALHMWAQDYPGGSLLATDLPAVYKLMKLRHVVVGWDANGNKKVMWPEEAIELQRTNQGNIPGMIEPQLVGLSDSMAQTLLGGGGHFGVRGAATRPLLNLQDSIPYPLLTEERLEELGMQRLGETSKPHESDITHVSSLPKATMSRKKGKEARTKWTQRSQKWHGEKSKTIDIRSRRRESGKGKFDIGAMNSDNASETVAMFTLEQLGDIFASMGVPHSQMQDLSALEISAWLAKNLDELLGGENNIIWVHDQTEATDTSRGVLGVADASRAYGRSLDVGPVFGDVVVIKLNTLLAEAGTRQGAYDLGKDVIREYADRGLAVVLASENGDQGLRADLAAWMKKGSLDYESVGGSGHIFAPILQDPELGATAQMLHSALTEVQQVRTKGVALALVQEESADTGISEGVQYFDAEHSEEWQRVVASIMPTAITGTSATPGKERWAFNRPAKGMDGVDQYAIMAKKILDLLEDPENHKWLKQLGGGDPSGFNHYKKHENGVIEPGVLNIEDALAKLKSQLEAGVYPTDEGEVLHTGSIIPLITGTDTILLARVGYEIPDMLEMGGMLSTQVGEKKHKRGGPPGAGIAIAKGSIDKNHSVPPPFTVDRVESDDRGVRVIGYYGQGKMAKEISEGAGLKEGLAFLPQGLKFPEAALSAINGLRVTKLKGMKGVLGKEADLGFVDNFRWAFALSGIDFRQDMIEFFWGPMNDPTDEAEFKTQWNKTKVLLDRWAKADHGMSAQDIERGLDAETVAITVQNGINAIGDRFGGIGWQPIDLQQDSNNPDDPKRRLAMVLLSALAAPDVRVEDVISTSGLMTVENLKGNAQFSLMPPLFTDALEDIAYPQLRELLRQRINSRMPINPETGNPSYYLNADWKFDIEMWDDRAGTAGDWVIHTGILQMTMPIPADENHVVLAQAALKSQTTLSPHIAAVQGAANTGIQTAAVRKKRALNPDGTPKLDAKGKPMTEIVGVKGEDTIDELWKNDVLRFDTPGGATMWDMLRRVSDEDVPYNPWERLLPLQWKHLDEADKWVRRYVTPVDKSKWEDTVRVKGRVNDLLTKLGLTERQDQEAVEIDYLVRQFLGRPGRDADQPVGVDDITQDAYLQVVELMIENVGNNMHMLHGGAVPLEHQDFWFKVFKAQEKRNPADRYSPVKYADGKRTDLAETWYEWVDALIGQTLQSNTEFHAMFRTPLDGFWHTYQGTTPGLLTQQLSMDDLVNLKLMDAATNRLYLSIDPGEDALLKSPIILESEQMTYEALMGYPSTIAGLDSRTTETSSLQQQLDRQKKWLAGEKLAPQKQVSVREYARKGVEYQESQRITTNFFRGLTNLSITMRLFNPALYVSAMIEVPIRNSLEHATNLITGQYTGLGSSSAAKVGAKAGIDQRFTEAETAALHQLAKQLGSSNMWLGELFKEMTYQQYVEVGGTGKVSQLLEKGAFTAAKVTSDPRWGMRGDSAAMRYLEGAWQYLALTGNKITVAQFLQKMEQDPLWLMKNSPTGRISAHSAGVNAVANVRATRQTSLGKFMTAPITAWTSSDAFGVNFAGHLLKIPFLFARFNINALMTLTGLNMFDQAAAMFVDQRQMPPILRRMGSLARMQKYDPNEVRRLDMTDVLQGVDLSHAFARGAITQTGLMVAGMMASGLNLSGEDEEERRRRRMSEYLNIPYYLDPRQAYNDFRWTDAIFLDNVPILDNIFSNNAVTEDENGNPVTVPGHSAVVPHWILRQFLSPILGMERFFETGNAKEIAYGFDDAISVVPYSVRGIWKDATETTRMLADAAKETENIPGAEIENNSSQLLINIVSIYEKALLENAFVNSMRSALDTYDRNPWIVPMTAEGDSRNADTGELDRLQGTGLPQETNALRPYVRGEGEDATISAGYATRTHDDALRHQYAENNFTASVLMSLFTGQFTDSSYFRQNMAVKERTVEMTPATKEYAEALFHQAFMAPGHQVMWTKDEIAYKLKARDEAAGKRWDQEEIDAQAEQVFMTQTKEFALSFVDPEGRELIAKDGAKGIFTSLRKGLITFGDPVLANIGITQEMRDEIAREIQVELVQEGLDYGLPEVTAKYRKNRIWWGDQDDPAAPGLREIIYSNKIPSKVEATYQQLNTTYVMGPDGRPWATPFQRSNVMQTMGIPSPHKMNETIPGVTALDTRGNTVDLVRGINTGMAALVPTLIEPEAIVPNDDITDEVDDKKFTTSRAPYGNRSYGRGYSGGYGGGGYSSSPYFTRMNPLPTGTSARADGIPAINTSNPFLRRASIRRERISTERGRLKQWQ